MKYLEDQAFYMNIYTGSVSTGAEWIKDFEDRQEKEVSWDEWFGDSLVEVTLEGDEWREIE